MFINNLNPDLLTLGPLHIRLYGIVYALGFVILILHLRAGAKKGSIRNLSADGAMDLSFYSMIGIVIGSRIGHVLLNYPYYMAYPLKVLEIWNGGMAFIGGLLGSLATAYYYCKKHDISLYQVADACIIYLPLVVALGRIANFINSELYGRVTNLPWAVNFNQEMYAVGNLVYRHPSQLYEFLLMLLLFLILYFMVRKRNAAAGFILYSFLWLYGVQRFFIEFIRENKDFIFGLSPMQYVSLAMVGFGAYKTNQMLRNNRDSPIASEQEIKITGQSK